MKTLLSFLLILPFVMPVQAQDYQFEDVYDIKCTPVVSQGRTGTCWSFSTTSFLESEIIRTTGKQIKLSEMYTVRNTYVQKAWNYVMRQGKAQFSQGGLSHDVINSVAVHGLVPESAFLGKASKEEMHNHSELVGVLKGMLDVYIKNPARELSPRWKLATESMLDLYMGENPEKFTYEGKEYTPESFLKMTKLNPKDYVSITSFTHQPYYEEFILNIPDNFSNGSFHNVKLDEMMQTVEQALKNGYTVALDCDVSEKTFSGRSGIAVLPSEEGEAENALTSIKPEKEITAKYRQAEFENYNTTDDHLMHITGMAKDQNGNKYFKVKNSWGSEGMTHDGYVYMSEAYMRLKTISVLVHKDAIPKSLKSKIDVD